MPNREAPMKAESNASRPAYAASLATAIVLSLLALPLTFESGASTATPTALKILSGWRFVLTGQSTAWVSFPAVLLAWLSIMAGKPRVGMVLAAAAVGNMLPYVAATTLTYGWGDLIRKEKQSPALGYFVVLVAMMVTFASALQARRLFAAAGAAFVSRAMIVALASLLVLPAAVLLSKEVVLRKLALERHRREIGSPQERFEALVRQGSRPSEPVNIAAAAVNEVAHAPAGGIPPMLDVRRMGERIEIHNRGLGTVSIDAWFVTARDDDALVICHFFPVNRYSGGEQLSAVPARIAPGKSQQLLVAPEGLEAADACHGDADSAPLNFFVRSPSMDTGDVLFAPDVAFRPKPPPNAESVRRIR